MRHWADLILGIHDSLGGLVRTASANAQATLGCDCRVLSQGRIQNILKDRAAIRIGRHARIRGEILTFAHGGHIEIGDWFYCGPGARLWSSNDTGISIGDRVLIGPGVSIYDTDSHPLDSAERFKQTKAVFSSGHPTDIKDISSKPVVIRDDVWIATGATILKGATIGAGAVIGAASVVSGDVPDGAIIRAGTIITKP